RAEDGIRDFHVTGVQTCALPISSAETSSSEPTARSASRESSTTLPTTRLPRGFQISGLGSDAGSASSSSRVSSQGRSSSSGGGRSEERRVGKESTSLCCTYT